MSPPVCYKIFNTLTDNMTLLTQIHIFISTAEEIESKRKFVPSAKYFAKHSILDISYIFHEYIKIDGLHIRIIVHCFLYLSNPLY